MPNKPSIAIIYDFDKTLSPRDMQEYSIIPGFGMTPSDFWSQVNALIDREGMDSILAYTFLMIEKSRQHNVPITKERFYQVGKNIEFFEGVLDWFERINKFCAERELNVEHYIVSSGIKEIILGTPIAKYFKKIYACEFLYDAQGNIQWPKIAVNYTTKTQFIFRINKGVLDITSKSDQELNSFTPEHERHIPFANMVYIGDGFTDVPCMKLVKSHGGHSIAVFDPDKQDYVLSADSKAAQIQLLQADRVNTTVAADYRQGSNLENVVQLIIEKIRADEDLKATVPLISS